MSKHRWEDTMAHRLFSSAEISSSNRRRYATERGVAFEAKPTADGTWHGFPIPWESVPAELTRKWLTEKSVTSSQVKRTFAVEPGDIHWAIDMEKD